MKSANPNSGFHEEQIAKCLDTNGGNPNCNQGGNVIVQDGVKCLNPWDTQTIRQHAIDGVFPTLQAGGEKSGLNRAGVVYPGEAALCVGNGQLNQIQSSEQAGALNCMHDQQAVVYPANQITSPTNRSNPIPGDPAPSLTCDSRHYLVSSDRPKRKHIVRRLTPVECARLQGMPDWWCEGLGGSDSAIYKAYGNGLALPCAYDVLRRLSRLDEDTKQEV